MLEISICVLCSDASEIGKVHPAVWFDLFWYCPNRINEKLEDLGADPQLAKIVDCRGFHDYMPKDIEEACDLTQEYLFLDNRSLWPFLLTCLQESPKSLAGLTMSDLEIAFCGFYDMPDDYLKEVATQKWDIDKNFSLLPFIDWTAYGKHLIDEQHIFVFPILDSGKVAVFDLSAFKEFDINDYVEAA